MEKSRVRETNLEYLRIISMIFIVAGHSVIHGGVEMPLTVNGIFSFVMTQGSRIGVNIFVLLSGYFSATKVISIDKIKKIYIQVWSYSIIIAMILFALGKVSCKDIFMSSLPISTSQYWFATCYMILLLISPALRIFIHNVDRKTFQKILITLFILWSVVPTIHIGQPGYSNMGWFVFVYLLAGYMKMYPARYMDRINVLHGIVAYGMLVVFAVVTYIYGYNIPFFRENAKYLYAEMNTVSGIICSILLFLGFRNLKIKSNPKINKIAGCTFGVYLFHDHPLIRKVLWIEVLGNANHIDESLFPLRLSLSIIGVFLIGIVFEYCRQTILGRKSYNDNKKRNGHVT